jgi:hypothetical protein
VLVDHYLERIYYVHFVVFLPVQLPKHRYIKINYDWFPVFWIFLHNDEPNVFLQLFPFYRMHLDRIW